MYNIFNMGIGMVIAVDEEDAAAVARAFSIQCGEKAYTDWCCNKPGIKSIKIRLIARYR